MNEIKKITFQEASILKHYAKMNDVKMTLFFDNDHVRIYMRDFEFNNFQSALRFLQEDSKMIIRNETELVS